MRDTLIENILGLLQNTDFDVSLVTEVLRKLEIFGVEVFENDFYLIAFAIKSVELGVKTFCNIESLNEKLHSVVTDRVCGEVLYSKYINKELPVTLRVEEVVKHLSMGDTNVTYENNNTKNEVLVLIELLKTSGEGVLLCCRKISW